MKCSFSLSLFSLSFCIFTSQHSITALWVANFTFSAILFSRSVLSFRYNSSAKTVFSVFTLSPILWASVIFSSTFFTSLSLAMISSNFLTSSSLITLSTSLLISSSLIILSSSFFASNSFASLSSSFFASRSLASLSSSAFFISTLICRLSLSKRFCSFKSRFRRKSSRYSVVPKIPFCRLV